MDLEGLREMVIFLDRMVLSVLFNFFYCYFVEVSILHRSQLDISVNLREFFNTEIQHFLTISDFGVTRNNSSQTIRLDNTTKSVAFALAMSCFEEHSEGPRQPVRNI